MLVLCGDCWCFSNTKKYQDNQTSDIVTKSKDEHNIFRFLGHNIPDFKEQGDVTLAFDVLCGRKCTAAARYLLPQHLADICDVVTNIHWAKSVYWVKWWSRGRKQRMFCKACTLRDGEEWDATPNTNNPVESLNRQSIAEGCRNFCADEKYLPGREAACRQDCHKRTKHQYKL